MSLFKYIHSEISNIGNQTQYYVYAENDSSGQFSPKRAAYEFYQYVLPINSGEIAINELLAINDNVVQSEYGEFSDWIELHNNTNTTIATNDLFITDNSNNLQKWRLPNYSNCVNFSAVFLSYAPILGLLFDHD